MENIHSKFQYQCYYKYIRTLVFIIFNFKHQQKKTKNYSFFFFFFTYVSLSKFSNMNLIHNVLNVILPLVLILTLFVSVPPYIIYNLINYIIKLVSSPPENLAGKVVLITGASSGIGEVCIIYSSIHLVLLY